MSRAPHYRYYGDSLEADIYHAMNEELNRIIEQIRGEYITQINQLSYSKQDLAQYNEHIKKIETMSTEICDKLDEIRNCVHKDEELFSGTVELYNHFRQTFLIKKLTNSS